MLLVRVPPWAHCSAIPAPRQMVTGAGRARRRRLSRPRAAPPGARAGAPRRFRAGRGRPAEHARARRPPRACPAASPRYRRWSRREKASIGLPIQTRPPARTTCSARMSVARTGVPRASAEPPRAAGGRARRGRAGRGRSRARPARGARLRRERPAGHGRPRRGRARGPRARPPKKTSQIPPRAVRAVSTASATSATSSHRGGRLAERGDGEDGGADNEGDVQAAAKRQRRPETGAPPAASFSRTPA